MEPFQDVSLAAQGLFQSFAALLEPVCQQRVVNLPNRHDLPRPTTEGPEVPQARDITRCTGLNGHAFGRRSFALVEGFGCCLALISHISDLVDLQAIFANRSRTSLCWMMAAPIAIGRLGTMASVARTEVLQTQSTTHWTSRFCATSPSSITTTTSF